MKKVWISSALLVACFASNASASPKVELLRTPQGGIQPQAVLDDGGTLHLVYFADEPGEGNVYYVQRADGKSKWSEPVRVNSEQGSARRNGAISHAQLAVAPDGRVHVTWFTMQPPRYFYARSRSDGAGFEKQRNLVEKHRDGVEAGASVAVSEGDGVYVVWHAGSFSEEDERRVYMVRSRDGGTTFGPETRIDDGRGVCACCGLSAISSGGEEVYVSYRAATDLVDRDLTLLTSVDDGESFTAKKIHKWNIPACPVSTTRLATGPKGRILITWETEGQVYFTSTDELRVVPAPGTPSARRKNPVLAMNASGELLLAWGDGPGWRSGGVLHWQVFDAERNATDVKGRAEEMAEFSVPTAVARPDGTFVVIY